MKNISILLISIILFSCESNQGIIENPDNLLIGNWINPSYNNEETTFSRANSLPNKNAGISFKLNGDFIKRTSGWCGTPPLTFFNIEGNWQLKEDIIKISTPFYPNNYSWRIISLNESKLIVKKESSEQEKDHQKLMVLFNEISTLSYSISCTNSSDWAFTAYGAKACGGP